MRFPNQQPSFAALQPRLQDWFNTETGGAMLAVERDLLQPVLSNSFGYHLLQLGVDPRHCLYGDSRVRRKLRAGPGPEHSELNAYCDFDALPFAGDSLDVVIIHHVLEFAANPHAVLREIQRVTLPGGRVFVLGFNPWSLQGLRTLYGRMSGRGIWQNRMLSAHRVNDWMELLGFETEPAIYAFHRPPLALQGLPPTAPEASWLRRGNGVSDQCGETGSNVDAGKAALGTCWWLGPLHHQTEYRPPCSPELGYGWREWSTMNSSIYQSLSTRAPVRSLTWHSI